MIPFSSDPSPLAASPRSLAGTTRLRSLGPSANTAWSPKPLLIYRTNAISAPTIATSTGVRATAHTTDLLAALAQRRQLTHHEADSMLQAIPARLATATDVFTQGEQDRLAVAVVSLIRRKDFDASGFTPWLARFQGARPRRLDTHDS